MERLTKRVLVMASGAGSTFQALVHGLKGSHIQVVGLIASRPGIGAIEKAKTLGIPTKVQEDEKLPELVKQFEPDLIVLAGYLKKLSPEFVKAFEGKVINVHPALLPKYGGKGMYGRKVHESVRAAGDLETGATVHWVTENYDEGPVVAQARLPIDSNEDVDSIEERVKSLEKELLISAVKGIFARQP